ncbi:hypothetical protein FGO68_gene3101 [Halteria grandinella]|uniref:Aldehyde dehydrogenase n=1 Tax=Halteria grandinella TaxID=5974 RepID=A0A8J8T227_HALGN|nr:hypothetical protein FGO68_gene3101 [Halteria grandinella]
MELANQTVDKALRETREGFLIFKTRTLVYREAQLRSMLKGLSEMRKQLCEGVRNDLGRQEYATWFLEICLVEGEIEHTLRHLKAWIQPIQIDTPLLVSPAQSKILYEPLGVVAVLGSWNFPIFTLLTPLVNVIAAGNCAIIRPSELAPHTSSAVAKFIERYLDRDCYRCVEGQVEIARAITEAKFDGICFTGSTEKGKLVAQAAAKNLVPCVLELGGKSPSVIDITADIDHAAKKIVNGRFMNAGQACVAPDYVLVHHSLTTELIAKVKKYLTEFWNNGKTVEDFGKIISEQHEQRLLSLVKTQSQGEIISCGHSSSKPVPTIVLNPSLDSPLMKEEIFGPILPILTFNTFDDAIRIINKLDKPLVVYYFGDHFGENFKRLENETSSGALISNETMFHLGNSDMPFGGVGMSGYGRYHGFEGFKQFSNCKGVLHKPPLNMFPYTAGYPPYSKGKQAIMAMLQKMRGLTKYNPVRIALEAPYKYGLLAKL